MPGVLVLCFCHVLSLHLGMRQVPMQRRTLQVARDKRAAALARVGQRRQSATTTSAAARASVPGLVSDGGQDVALTTLPSAQVRSFSLMLQTQLSVRLSRCEEGARMQYKQRSARATTEMLMLTAGKPGLRKSTLRVNKDRVRHPSRAPCGEQQTLSN